MDDNAIIALYWAREERALEETSSKYGSYCRNIAYNILCNREDTEECVNDTWLRAWNAMPPQRPRYLKSFLAKLTRNLSLDRWDMAHAEKRGGGEMELVLEELEGCIAAPGRVEDRMNGQELAKTIRSFLDTLPAREQDIFLRRYFFVEESAVIARRYGMKPASVLKTLSRTREKLKRYLAKEGYAV